AQGGADWGVVCGSARRLGGGEPRVSVVKLFDHPLDEIVKSRVALRRIDTGLVLAADGLPIDAVESRVVVALIDGGPHLLEDGGPILGGEHVLPRRIARQWQGT